MEGETPTRGVDFSLMVVFGRRRAREQLALRHYALPPANFMGQFRRCPRWGSACGDDGVSQDRHLLPGYRPAGLEHARARPPAPVARLVRRSARTIEYRFKRHGCGV